MITLPQGDLPEDSGIPRTAAQHNAVNVGVYASGVLCGFDLLPGWANAHEGMGGNGRGDTGEQAPEGVRAVAGQLHLVGNLLEGGLDPVAPFSAGLWWAGPAQRCPCWPGWRRMPCR